MSLEAEEWVVEYWDDKWLRDMSRLCVDWNFVFVSRVPRGNHVREIPPLALQDAINLAKFRVKSIRFPFRIRNTRTGDILPEVIL